MARIRLVTRGDDSGSSRAANQAVADAFRKGILRNTSLMVPGPAFTEAAGMLKDLKGLCVGLHGTVTDEWNESRWGPVLGAARVPTLVQADGTFFKDTRALWDRTPRPSNDEIVAELKAQLERARAAGLDPKYLDSHMGFDWFEGLREKMAAFAKAEGLLYQPPGLARLPDVRPAPADPVEGLMARLDRAEEGKTYLLVTHPAYDTEEMRRLTYGDRKPGEIARERDGDRRMLMDPRIVAYVRDLDVEPIRFTDLG